MLRIHLLALTAASAMAAAPSGPVHKTTLQTQPFPGPVYHSVLVHTLVDRGGTVPAHTHPGVEMAYVAEGRATLRVKGRADQTLAKGGSFSIPAETVHSVVNAGQGPLTIISTYVVEKNKPIASPAPAF